MGGRVFLAPAFGIIYALKQKKRGLAHKLRPEAPQKTKSPCPLNAGKQEGGPDPKNARTCGAIGQYLCAF